VAEAQAAVPQELLAVVVAPVAVQLQHELPVVVVVAPMAVRLHHEMPAVAVALMAVRLLMLRRLRRVAGVGAMLLQSSCPQQGHRGPQGRAPRFDFASQEASQLRQHWCVIGVLVERV